MGAQNFNFALNFHRMVFSPKFCISGRTFSDKKKIFQQFSDNQKFKVGNSPLYHYHDGNEYVGPNIPLTRCRASVDCRWTP